MDTIEYIELGIGETRFDGIAAGPKDGDLVVLLHGFPQTPRAWRRQVEALGKAGFRAVAPALRGFGPGTPPPDIADYTQPLVASDVLGIVASFGSESFHLVGHDLGGIVAWDIAGRFPEVVRTLSIASTPHLTPFALALSAGTADRLPPFELFRQAGVAEDFMLGSDAKVLRAGYAGLDDESIEEYVAHFRSPGALTAALDHFRAFEYADWLDLVPASMPTLFMWGTEDPYLAETTAKETADYATGTYQPVPLDGIGHWVPEMAGDAVTELLLAHLGVDIDR
jgi:pimeloyl-ACP methyl ester carboxylesterase